MPNGSSKTVGKAELPLTRAERWKVSRQHAQPHDIARAITNNESPEDSARDRVNTDPTPGCSTESPVLFKIYSNYSKFFE
jgi:hypothetical protein